MTTNAAQGVGLAPPTPLAAFAAPQNLHSGPPSQPRAQPDDADAARESGPMSFLSNRSRIFQPGMTQGPPFANRQPSVPNAFAQIGKAPAQPPQQGMSAMFRPQSSGGTVSAPFSAPGRSIPGFGAPQQQAGKVQQPNHPLHRQVGLPFSSTYRFRE